MNLGIEGRTALVVGASRGIGQEIARELKAEGCKVFTVSRSGNTDFNMDLLTDGQTNLLALSIPSPDIVVHVVGGSQGITSAMSSADQFAKVWALNIGIAIDLNWRFIPAMRRSGWGRIIHISTSGRGYAPYMSAKGAVEGYVKAMSREFSKDGVIITAVAPGIVLTPGRYFASLDEKAQQEYFDKYIPINRFGRAEEVAKVVSFLASEHSAYMAGAIVQIDGGAR